MNIQNSPTLCFSRPQRPTLRRRVRGNEGAVLLCHGCKGPTAGLAVSHSGCSSPPPPPHPSPSPLTPLFFFPFSSSSFCFTIPVSVWSFSSSFSFFSFFSPTPSSCNQKKPKTISHPFQRDTHQELHQWIAHEEASLGLSSVFLLVAQPGPFPSSCSPMPSAHKYILHLYTLNAFSPLPINSTLFSHKASGEVTYRCTMPQDSSYT